MKRAAYERTSGVSDYTLRTSTCHPEVDHILQAIVGHYEHAFPQSIRAYYVIGSYADASAVPISDIDVVIVFARPLTSDQLAQAHALAEHCAERSPIRLDIGLALEDHLSGIEQVLLKLGSLFVYGDDVRDQLVLPPLALYQRDVTWSPYRFLGQIMRNQLFRCSRCRGMVKKLRCAIGWRMMPAITRRFRPALEPSTGKPASPRIAPW